MEGRVVMSRRELDRALVIGRVVSGDLTLRTACEMLGLSLRQGLRLRRSFRASGAGGLAHKLRGQPSNRALEASHKERVVEVYKEQYAGFGPTLASEMMAERNGILVHRETLRLWLIGEKLHEPRKRRRRHRSRRKRKERFGEMGQMDGSFHDWFEGRAPKCCLMTMVDDATGTVWALFTSDEGTAAAMRLLWRWIVQFGVPHSLYVDRLKTYVTDREPTIDEQLADQPPVTQFGRACQKLGVRVIAAHSPQAKGRVERKHKLTQDRLIKEMRLANICCIEEANAFLETWLPKINKRFSVAPVNSDDMHRTVPEGLDLRTVFCLEDTRTVKNDWTVQFENHWLQILKQQPVLPAAGAKVTVQRWLDETLHVTYLGQPVAVKPLDARPAKQTPTALPTPKATYKPSEEHPWKTSRQRPYDLRRSNEQIADLADRLLGPVSVPADS